MSKISPNNFLLIYLYSNIFMERARLTLKFSVTLHKTWIFYLIIGNVFAYKFNSLKNELTNSIDFSKLHNMSKNKDNHSTYVFPPFMFSPKLFLIFF